MDERSARMGLCALGAMASPKLAALVDAEGATAVWAALRRGDEDSAWSRRARGVDVTRMAAATEACGSRFVVPGDPEWPSSLDGLRAAEVSGQGGAPFGLWVLGAPVGDLTGGVAIVGARAATQYGQHVAQELAADLAAGGLPVVSGLAHGIDAAAHRGALVTGGRTVAVVAGGVDEPYPASNAALAAQIARRGSVVSEAPPGVRPTRPAFLARNRLIAGLSEGVVVVEAALRSGAKNTAAWGNELGRVVMAVPGQVTSSMSQTPHRLVRDGQAVLVPDSRDVRELLEPLGTVEEAPRRGRDTALDRLPPEQRALREAFVVGEEVSSGVLARRTGLPMPVCLASLHALVEGRWIEEGDGGGWRLPVAPVGGN